MADLMLFINTKYLLHSRTAQDEAGLTRRTHQLAPSVDTQGDVVDFWDSQVSSSLRSIPHQSLRETGSE